MRARQIIGWTCAAILIALGVAACLAVLALFFVATVVEGDWEILAVPAVFLLLYGAAWGLDD